MTIKKKDNLTTLIQALSSNEKRYFRLLFDKSDSDKNYLMIFNAIEKNPDITNEGLKKALKNDKVNISYEKSYLQRNILKSLRQFHEGSSNALIAGQILSDLEQLFNKGLYDQVLHIIESNTEWAENNELYGFLMDMMKWKRSVYLRTNRYDLLARDHESMHSEEMRYLQNMQTSSIYRSLLSAALATISSKGLMSGPELEMKLEKILQHPYLTDISKAKGYQSVCMFHECHAMCYQFMVKLEEAYHSQMLQLQYMEKHPDRIKAGPGPYITALLMLTAKCTGINRYDEGLKALDTLQDFLSFSKAEIPKSLAISSYCHLVEYRITILLSAKRYQQLIDIYSAEQDRLKKHKEFTSKRTTDVIHVYVGTALFFLKKYDDALDHVRMLIDDNTQGGYGSMILNAYMLNLMIHYELRNFDLIPYLLRSFMRYCKKNDFNQEFVAEFMELMQKLIKNPADAPATFAVYSKIFTELTLKQRQNDRYNAVTLSPIGIEDWVQSKIKK